MAHNFGCCCFYIFNMGRQNYCSFNNIKYETSRFLCRKALSQDLRPGSNHLLEPVLPQAAKHCRHLVWRVCGSYNPSPSTSWHQKHLMRSNVKPVAHRTGPKHTRQQDRWDFTRVLLQHKIFYIKGQSSIANLYYPWRKERVGKKKAAH